MILAGHLPTEHIPLEAWQKMPVYESENNADIAPSGWSRSRDSRGKPICIFMPFHYTRAAFAVRPIVRVKMGRREITAAQQVAYEFFIRTRKVIRNHYSPGNAEWMA